LVGAIRVVQGTTIWPFLLGIFLLGIFLLGIFLLGIFVGLGLPGSLGAAQQFSADLVGKSAGKIYVSNSRVRIEMSDFPGALFLLDGDAHTAYFVKPAQRVLMDAKQSSWLTQILVPLNPNDPCKQWQAMAEIAGAAEQGKQWRCNRLVPESTGGREPIKYRAISPEGFSSYCLIDPQLGFVVSIDREDGAKIDLSNIRQGPPPADLFEMPANFRTFDPHQLIDRIKQSDGWVEPPK
jgi:hypothetical protein